jgi:phosphatidyl-myo-inositol dimannoside synthase
MPIARRTASHAHPPLRGCVVRVLVITQDFGPAHGGIQRYTHELASRLAPQLSSLEVVAPDQPGAAAFDRQLAYGVRRLRCSSDAMPVAVAALLAAEAARGPIDAVLHTQWQTAPAGALLRRAERVGRLLIAAHGRELLLRPLARHAGAQRAYDRLRRSCLEAADAVLPVSAYTAGLVRREAPRAKTTVVPNGVAASEFAGGDRAAFRAAHGLGEDPVLLTVGRLVPRKGIDCVIRLLPRLLTRKPRLRYVVVGRGTDEPRLRALVRELRLEAHVRFVGSLDAASLRDAYAACDVFVLATREDPDSVEGFGLVLLEASAAGRATVTTAVGGTAEAVLHGRTGLVVPADAAEPLATAIALLLDNPARARELGAHGSAHARAEGSWDRTAELVLHALCRSESPP